MSSLRGASLWWDTLPRDLRAGVGTPLDGDADADVAIVGAGFTGLWTAYYLLWENPGIRVAVVEAAIAGFGASGRNGGWASALLPMSLDALAERGGREAAIAMQREMIASVDEVGAVIAREGWDVGWQKGGTVVVARTPTQWRRAREEVEHQRAWGFGDGDLALLGADEARERLAATDILGATYTPHCATIHPARLVRSLAHHVVVMGGRIHEATPATAIEPGVVRTTRGDVRAPIVVRATEGYTRTLRGERRAIAPVYSLMLATAPLDDGTWDAIGLAHRETFSDHRHLIVYGQRTADGRIAFGGRGAPYHLGSTIRPEYDRNTRVHAALRAALVELLPALRDVPITHAWGGPLGIARDWWASCGLDRSTGLAWAGGYVGDGVTTTNLAGRTLADLIAGRRTDLTALPWVDHRSPRWEPEPLRWIGANLALQVVAAADASERRTGRTSRVMPLFDRVMGR